MLPRGAATLLHLQLQHEIDGGNRIINVSGEIDIYTSPLLQSALHSARDARRIIVDLSDCRYLDGSGLSLFVRTHRRSGGRLALIVSGGIVEKVLRITGLYERLPVFSSRDLADESALPLSRVELRSCTAT